jgi:hypothetical protein
VVSDLANRSHPWQYSELACPYLKQVQPGFTTRQTSLVRLTSGEGMVEKASAVEPHRKAVVLIRHRSGTIAFGVGAFLLFIGETVGTAQELPTGTIDPSDRVSMERSGLGGIGNPATAMQNGQRTASPGQWLIDDVARERAEFELRQVSPKPLSATNAAAGDAAHVEAGVSLPSLDDARTGGDKRRSEDATSSIGAPTIEDGVLGVPPSHRALKRSDGAPPRPDTSRRRVDSAAKCIEAPVDLALEGEHCITASIAKLTESAGTFEPSGKTEHIVASSKAIDVRRSLLRRYSACNDPVSSKF